MTAPTLRKGARVVGAHRADVAADLKARYESGASIRDLAADLGRSYGFVHRLLDQAGGSVPAPRRCALMAVTVHLDFPNTMLEQVRHPRGRCVETDEHNNLRVLDAAGAQLGWYATGRWVRTEHTAPRSAK